MLDPKYVNDLYKNDILIVNPGNYGNFDKEFPFQVGDEIYCSQEICAIEFFLIEEDSEFPKRTVIKLGLGVKGANMAEFWKKEVVPILYSPPNEIQDFRLNAIAVAEIFYRGQWPLKMSKLRKTLSTYDIEIYGQDSNNHANAGEA